MWKFDCIRHENTMTVIIKVISIGFSASGMLNKSQRLLLGLFVLLLVDVIWVSSSELTKVSCEISVLRMGTTNNYVVMQWVFPYHLNVEYDNAFKWKQSLITNLTLDDCSSFIWFICLTDYFLTVQFQLICFSIKYWYLT